MSEKELSNDLKHAIKWAAAEFKYIEELKKELAEVEQEKDVKKEVKEISKAIRILRYIGKAERRAANFEEKVEKDLKEVYEELSTHLGYDFSKKKKLMNLIREINTELDIEHDHLVNYASVYVGLLKEELIEAEAEAQLIADLERKHSSRKAEEIYADLMSLIYKIQEQVKDAEKWVNALQVSLKKAGKIIVVPKEEKKVRITINRSRIKELSKVEGQLFKLYVKASGFGKEGYSKHKREYISFDNIRLRLKKQKSVTILDVGCGDAHSLRKIKKEFGNSIVAVGADVRKPPKDTAYKILKTIDGYVVTTAEFLPKEWTNKFDVIYSMQAIRYTFFPMRAISEIARVLAPGGQAQLSCNYDAQWVDTELGGSKDHNRRIRKSFDKVLKDNNLDKLPFDRRRWVYNPNVDCPHLRFAFNMADKFNEQFPEKAKEIEQKYNVRIRVESHSLTIKEFLGQISIKKNI